MSTEQQLVISSDPLRAYNEGRGERKKEVFLLFEELKTNTDKVVGTITKKEISDLYKIFEDKLKAL